MILSINCKLTKISNKLIFGNFLTDLGIPYTFKGPYIIQFHSPPKNPVFSQVLKLVRHRGRREQG